MRLIALEIPVDSAELPGWLERQLLGFDLAALVADLEAIHGNLGSKTLPLDRLLGNARASVLERGLSALPPASLRQFLQHPRRLLDLQELVLVEGGPYWQRLAAGSPESARLDAEGWRRLNAFLTIGNEDVPQVSVPRTAETRRNPWRSIPIVVATAAGLLAVTLVYERSRELARPVVPAGNWGWLRPGAFDQELSRAAYLNQLAKEAEEWFNKRPDEPIALARRITEFRLGCTALILAEHRPLVPPDYPWLIQTCRRWASDLDKRLSELEDGINPRLVRSRVDQIARQIAKELRDRAAARA
jgi:hypothetical protein